MSSWNYRIITSNYVWRLGQRITGHGIAGPGNHSISVSGPLKVIATPTKLLCSLLQVAASFWDCISSLSCFSEQVEVWPYSTIWRK